MENNENVNFLNIIQNNKSSKQINSNSKSIEYENFETQNSSFITSKNSENLYKKKSISNKSISTINNTITENDIEINESFSLSNNSLNLKNQNKEEEKNLNFTFFSSEEEIKNSKEYINEIYKNLLLEEKNTKITFGYMQNQPDINDQMRAILIDWLIEVHFRFRLKSKTLFLTVNIIDSYLSYKIIHRAKLQLLGIASLLIACKCEEIYYPSINDFVDITDKAYFKEELLNMEFLVLETLNFNILNPTSSDFYDIISKFYLFNQQQYYLGKYFLESCLIDYRMTKYSNSILACSSIYLVMKYFGLKNYQLMYDYCITNQINSQKIIKQAGKEIFLLIKGLKSTNLKSTIEKYSLKQFESVSDFCEKNN